MNVTGGSQDVSVGFVLRLAVTGVEAPGLTIANMDLQYWRVGANAPVAKVDATALSAITAAHTDNYAIEVDATDQPGLYRVDWPDAAFAAGARQVILTVKCATVFTEHMVVEIDPPVDVTKISGDATAADNLESYCDGTTPIPANATQLSGDATAADNAELMFDGTGYAGGTTKLVVADSSGVTSLLSRVPDTISLAAINAEVDTALNTAIPGSPTADSVNERLKAVDDLTQASGGGDLAAILLDTGTDGVKIAAAQIKFKKNVAFPNFCFPMKNAAGALQTGLALLITASIRKDNAASFSALAGSVTEVGTSGWYTVDWAQTETNADVIGFSATAVGAVSTDYTIFPQT